MKVKKYRASSMPEVMKKVRAELGAQAVILQSKTVYSGGFLGLFKKKNIEVVAAVDHNTALVTEMPDTVRPPVEQKPVLTMPAELKSEMNDVKKMIQELQKSASFALYPDVMKPVMEQLEKHGILRELRDQTASYLFEKWNAEKTAVTEKQIKEWASDYLKNCLPSIHLNEKKKAKYVYLLGPTGVGKTTTIAKLASKQVLEENKKLAFITTDTYRIAAIEQLKTYAGLLNAPMNVAYSEEDMKQAIREFDSFDSVFIDTAGRNYLEGQYVTDLQPMIGQRLNESAYFLVLSAAAKEEDLHEIIKNFSSVKLDGFIFTKVDETKTKGLMINLMYNYKVGTSYIANGQNVPDDLIESSNDILIECLFKD
ncbi:flagellar biosynthesis protein FlhF [Domibacillus iocasae]|uniref:Flagellar biosynthesis protein FlhF n=1 Tax=Domibacillus iocasae TaxID=1714016 RepID=A0A1E7DLP4_9BACI|nr:flagellar biosynthesis protein FlhF [Domibacillus iocasae]OES43598.1 flagellar biosynthesis protein FlhF [Domibacillus iocasae]